VLVSYQANEASPVTSAERNLARRQAAAAESADCHYVFADLQRIIEYWRAPYPMHDLTSSGQEALGDLDGIEGGALEELVAGNKH
jgi:hypothetical protein